MASKPVSDANMVSRELGDADGGELRGQPTRTLYQHWRRKKGGRPYPAWAEIQLMELWEIAEDLLVKDVIAGSDDLRTRYCGTGVARASGIDSTGRTLTEVHGASSEAAGVNFRRAVAGGRPVVSYRRLTFIDGRDHVTFEAVHLPLGPAGGPVMQVISAFDFDCDVADILGA